MSKTQPLNEEKGIEPIQQLETGTYEIIRNRLQQHTDELKKRLDALNQDRKEVFGAIETQLVANDRINTANYCNVRDMIALGNHCIFGYNVHIGLRSGIELKDVFSIYSFEGNSFREHDLSLLKEERFQTDFQNLYRYYKDAFFARFVKQGSFLYMVFQISKNIGDVKAFKWLIKEEEIVYIDARSEHEILKSQQYDFQWKRLHRDAHRNGKHPHVSILDRVFVETVGGDLTIKVEDNTDDGLGIFREEVEHKDQTLDDADYFFADLGNLIAIKIKPYRETYRHYIYNEKTQKAQRIDSLAYSGVLLPSGHGLIFPNGYYLQTSEFKIFENNTQDLQFEYKIASPNGEDYLFVFHNEDQGTYILHHYNTIEQRVNAPIFCNGFTIFPNGELAYFKTEKDPTKHHVIQIWQTPFLSTELVPSQFTDRYLYKVGNKDIVFAMAECHEILSLSLKDESYANLYDDIVKKCTEVLDSYYWIDKKEAYFLNEPLREIKDTANLAIEEFEKKIRIQKNTENQIDAARTKASNLFQTIETQQFNSIELYVKVLTDLRVLRGEIIALKDLRYVDEELVLQLEEQTVEKTYRLSESCLSFLLKEDALTPYVTRIDEQENKLEAINTVVEAKEQEEEIDGIAAALQMLIDIVSGLNIEDATQTTNIIDSITVLYAKLNQLKAAVKRRSKALMSTEATAEFNAQLKLIDQSIINYLDVSDTMLNCDEYLTRLVIQLEELESRFAEFDDFILTLAEKREEVYNAFENKKKNLLEKINNRTSSLQKAANRILSGIQNKAQSLGTEKEIHSFFASDLMIEKVREIILQLVDLSDNNKADNLQTRLKNVKEEAIQQLRDKKELFVDGKNSLKFGRHVFSVNVQPLELTIVQKDNDLFFHLTGTDFYEQIEDDAFLSNRSIWDQSLISENEEVYRSEYLAYKIFKEKPDQLSNSNFEQLLAIVKENAKTLYQEGYVKGVHDEDAAKILKALIDLEEKIDLLCFTPDIRGMAHFFWKKLLDKEQQAALFDQIKSARLILEVFPNSKQFEYLISEIQKSLESINDKLVEES